MRNPAKRPQKTTNEEAFINAANSLEDVKEPWNQNLSRKYDKTTGKTINVRLPEHYAKCLEWLSEKHNRSQHGQLVHFICDAIDREINK